MDTLTAALRTDLVPKALLDPVVAYFHPRRVYLFGSRARGDHHADSDHDLLVVLDDDAPDEMFGWRAGYEASKSYRGAADVIPCHADWFRRHAGICGTLAYAAVTEGTMVYERS